MPHRAHKTPTPYRDPVARLLTLGDPIPEHTKRISETPFVDYAALGIAAAHIPDLIRLTGDGALLDDPGIPAYAPVHAARALATFGDPAAILHLIDFTRRLDRIDADYWLELMPPTLARFGEPAIDPIARIYRDSRERFGLRFFLGEALETIATVHPSTRQRVIKVFTDFLAYARYTDPSINADAIGSLTELLAPETLPAIRAAFATGNVDITGCGQLEEVEAEIILTPEARDAKRKTDIERLLAEHALDPDFELVEDAKPDPENLAPEVVTRSPTSTQRSSP